MLRGHRSPVARRGGLRRVRYVVALAAAAAATGCNCRSCKRAGETAQGIGPVVVVSGWHGNECRADDVLQLDGQGKAYVEGFEPERNGCLAEIAAFAPGAGVVAAGWPLSSTGEVSVVNGALHVPFPRLRTLKVAVWVLTDDTKTPQWVIDQVAYANDLFSRSGVGIVLDTVVRTVPLNLTLEDLYKGGCQKVKALQDELLYHPGVVNAYLYRWDDVANRGVSCTAKGENLAYEPSALFVYSADFNRTLAHELGHALGLQEPNHGHTEYAEGFECPPHPPNIMWGSLPPDLVGAEEDITLGQAYRMNVDSLSWWNLPPTVSAVSIAPVPAMTRRCDAEGAKHCPPLALRGGP
jgi:hypothetical protein